MKVVFFTPQFYPHVGGVEKHVYELSKRLQKEGHTVIIITEDRKNTKPSDQNNWLSDQEMKKFNVYKIPITTVDKWKKFQIWQWLYQHRQLLRDADIIHIHDVFYWYLPFKILFPQKNVYTTFHGYESYPIPRRNILMRQLFEKLSSGTICVGHFMQKWYHQHPTKIVYGGVNTFLRKSITKHNAIFIGRLDEQTGFASYIEALRIIREKVPSFTLTVYGDGPLRNLAVKTEGVVYKGFDISAEEKMNRFKYAFVSRNLAILEALANKCMVIAEYDNPLKFDYLTMAPYAKYLSIVRTPNDIADVVCTYQNNERTGKKKVAEGYAFVTEMTWDSVLNQYKRLWGIS